MEGVTVLYSGVVREDLILGVILILTGAIIGLAITFIIVTEDSITTQEKLRMGCCYLLIALWIACGITFCIRKTSIQKVKIDDSVNYNEFVTNYTVKGCEEDIWEVIPKEEK